MAKKSDEAIIVNECHEMDVFVENLSSVLFLILEHDLQPVPGILPWEHEPEQA
jgi:hypothetical protein